MCIFEITYVSKLEARRVTIALIVLNTDTCSLEDGSKTLDLGVQLLALLGGGLRGEANGNNNDLFRC
jgi:hypothetical protein